MTHSGCYIAGQAMRSSVVGWRWSASSIAAPYIIVLYHQQSSLLFVHTTTGWNLNKMSADKTVTSEELHTPTNTPAEVRSHLAPGVELTDAQAFQVGVVLDIFQGKGTQSKIDDAFTEDAVYEDKFADCKNREEIGASHKHLSAPACIGPADIVLHQHRAGF